MRKYLPLLANILSQMLFGFTYIFVKTGMQVIDQNAIKFLSYRFGLGFLIMTIVVIFGIKKVHYKNRPVYLVLLCGLANPVVSQVLETSATTYVPSAQLSMYISLIPIVTLALSAVINHEYPTFRQFCFVIVTVLGVLIANLSFGDSNSISTIGMILICGTIFTVSLGRVLVRRASEHFQSFEIVYLTTAMGAIIFLSISMSQHIKTAPLIAYFSCMQDKRFVISILYMGIGSCIGAFLLMTYASANLPIAVYSSTCSFSTVVGILSGIFILHETFVMKEIIGTIVILIGLVGVSLSYKADEDNRFSSK